MPPGRAKANEYLKRCRLDMKMVGEWVDVEVKMPEFHVRAYLAYHPKATDIFKARVKRFWAEALISASSWWGPNAQLVYPNHRCH